MSWSNTMQGKSLEQLLDSDYTKARDALIDSNRNTALSYVPQKSPPIPNLDAALSIRANEPAKSAQYTDALALEYTKFLDPRQHVNTPNSDQLKFFLEGFGKDFLPLLEEYLFQLPSKISNTGTRAAAMLLKDSDFDRCKQVAALSFAKFQSNPEVQMAILTAVEYCRAETASKELWNAYLTSTDPNLRLNAQYVLAGFGDKKMRAAIETSLSKDDLENRTRSNLVSAYLQYFPGSHDDKLVQAFRKFRNPATQLEISRNLFVTNREIAETLSELKKVAADEKVKAVLQEHITRFEAMDRER